MTDRDLGFVQRMQGDFIECRSLRHQFDLVYFGPVSGVEGIEGEFSRNVIVRQTVCARCNVIKESFFNPTNASRAAMGLTFTAFHNRYRYPAFYQWHAKDSSKERPTNGDYNYELYKRYNDARRRTE